MAAAWVRDGLAASTWAAVLSGVPATMVTLVEGGNILDSSAAAGTLVVPESSPRPVRLAAGGIAHGAVSLWWSLVLSRLLPRRSTAAWGVVAGLAIAAVDLGVIGRRVPAIRGLDQGRQVADHLAFGLVVGLVVARRRAAPTVIR